MNKVYNDAFLEHYADRYMGLGLRWHGVSLTQYLNDPPRYEGLPEGFPPPLPQQIAAILRLWHEQDTGLGVSSPAAPVIDEAQLVDPQALIAEWRLEAEAAERDVEHLPRRNGAIVEPLHHHCHPRRFGAANFNKRGV